MRNNLIILKLIFVLLLCSISLLSYGQKKKEKTYLSEVTGIIIDTVELLQVKSLITITKRKVIIKGSKPKEIVLLYPFESIKMPPYVMAREQKGIFTAEGLDEQGKRVGLYHDTNKKLLQVAYADQLYVYSDMTLFGDE